MMLMAHRRKKIVKKRGTRTCGHGGMRKCRGKGNRGGSGNSGSKKHRKSWFIKYEPDHLGKRGFIAKSHKSTRVVRTINLEGVERLAAAQGKDEINLEEHGYDKVLGDGKITKKLTVRASAFSRHAKGKIEEAGGKAVSE